MEQPIKFEVVVDDNWRVMGLSGTGSKDIVIDDAFVPEHRTHSLRGAFYLTNPGAAVNDCPLYRLPFWIVFPNCIASPAICVALGALNAFREQTKTRVSPRDQSRVAEDPFMQFRLAEAACVPTPATTPKRPPPSSAAPSSASRRWTSGSDRAN